MSLFDQQRLTGDPFALGVSDERTLELGYPMSRFAFPWFFGCVLLVRRRLYPTISAWSFCGAAFNGDSAIANWPGFAHQAGMGYQYACCLALGNGFVGQLSEPVRVDFDDNGERIVPPLPMPPIKLAVQAIAAGKYALSWGYNPFGQGGWPKDFQVFRGATAEAVDYASPLVDSLTGLNYVGFSARRRFEFTTAAYADGQTNYFAVRGRNSSGVAEKNIAVSAGVKARVAGPQTIAVEAVYGRRA